MDRLTKYQLNERTKRYINPNLVQLPPYVPDLRALRDDYAWHLETSDSADKWVAKHLSDLRTLGLDGDTIVFFFGDNGWLPRTNGHKFLTGLGVPLIVYIPPKWRHLSSLPIGEPTSQLVGFADFAPTVLSLANIETPGGMTGSAFLGSKAAPPRQHDQYLRTKYENDGFKPAGRFSMGAFTIYARTSHSSRRPSLNSING